MVRVIDSVSDVLMEVKFKEDQRALMINRGWIKLVQWNCGSEEMVEVISHEHLIEFLNEAAL